MIRAHGPCAKINSTRNKSILQYEVNPPMGFDGNEMWPEIRHIIMANGGPIE